MIGDGEGVNCFQMYFDAAKSTHRFEKLAQLKNSSVLPFNPKGNTPK